MLCDDILKKLKEKQDQINKLNAAEIIYTQEMKAGKSPEDVRDIMIHQHGIPPDVATAMIESARGWQPDMLKLHGITNEIGVNAEQFQKAAQSPNETVVNREFLKEKANSWRDRISDALSRSFNSLPKGMNDNLQNALRSFASFRDIMEIKPGSNVFAGRNTKFLIKGELENLHKDSGTTLPMKEFDIGLETAAQIGREENPMQYIKDRKEEIMSKMDKQPVLKQLLRKLDLAEQVYSTPGVKDYLDNTYKKLDTAREVAFPGEKGRDNYYHNHVIIEPHMDIWDSITSGDRRSFSRMTEGKVYKNGVEAEMAGARPSSDSFLENNGVYWSALANKLRKDSFAVKLKENAELTNADSRKMMIDVNADYSEAAFHVRPADSKNWETPKTSSGKYYKEMDNLGPQFRGVLAHPEVYKWQEKVFRHIDADGLAATTLKGMRMWKTLVLSGSSIIHGGSLAKKYAYLATSLGVKDGINNTFGVFSVHAEGLGSLKPDSPHFPQALKLMQNGLSLETYDMARNAAFNRKYNEYGDQTMLSTLGEKITDFTDWQHKLLFEKFRTGLKLGLGLRVLKSDYFADLVKKHNGDSNQAMAEISTMLNDHFGGQNLEMIGRSRIVQSFMQAMLLSPEWTEAKFKRAYGAFINPSDAIRKSYQYSLAAEFGSMLIMKIALQQIYSSMYNDPRTMDDMAKDIWNRRLASVYIGKTSDGKKELFATLGMSENQDLGLLLPFFKGTYESFAQGDISQLPKELAKEVGHKLSPAAKGIVDAMGRHAPEKKEGWGQKSLKFGEGFLPIGVAQVVDAAQGEIGEPASYRAGQAALGSLTGFPLTAYNVKKEPKKKKEEEKKGKGLRLVK